MEENVDNDLIVQNEDIPSTAKHGSNPQKARLTGLSIEGLKSNIQRKKLADKIEKYNREYNRLKDLAKEVNESRMTATTNSEYEEVTSGIRLYNAQAEKLAKIAVQILAFDDDIKKIGMAKDKVARGIKVPSFLVKSMRMLSKAGREEAQREKNAAVERKTLEEDMYKKIVETAKEAIDQNPEGVIDTEKFYSLDTDKVFANVKDAVLNEQTNEENAVNEKTVIVDEPVVEPKDEEKDPELGIRKGRTTPIPEETAPTPAPENNVDEADVKREQVDEGIRKVYERRNPQSKEESGVDLFKLVEAASRYSIVLRDDGPVLVKPVTNNGMKVAFTFDAEHFASSLGLSSENAGKNYSDVLELVGLANIWKKMVLSSSLSNKTNAFSDDKRGLFESLVASARSSGEKEKLFDVMNIFDGFSDAEKALLLKGLLKKNFSAFEQVVANEKNLDHEFVDALIADYEKNREVETEEDRKRREVDEAITKRAISKYGLKVDEDEKVDPVIEPIKVSDEEEKVEEEQKEEASSVDDLAKLQLELAELIKNKPPVDDAEKTDEYNRKLSELIGRINDIARNGLNATENVSEEPKVEEEKVEEEIVEPVVEQQEEDGRDKLDLWQAKNWAETMSDPESKEAKEAMLRGRFSDYDVEEMHKAANAAFDKEAEKERATVAAELSAKTRNDVQKRRDDLINKAKAFVLSEMFDDIDYDQLLDGMSNDDGVDVFKDEVEKRRSVDPNGFAWSVDSLVRKMAERMDEFRNATNYNERICSMAINDLINGTSEYDAARIINDVRISQKKEASVEVSEEPKEETVVDDNQSAMWSKIMSDPDEEKNLVNNDVVVSEPVVEENEEVVPEPVTETSEVTVEEPVVSEPEVSVEIPSVATTEEPAVVDDVVETDKVEGKVESNDINPTANDEVDDEHKDYYEWWTGMLPTLDDSTYQQASELNLARHEADRKADELTRDIEKRRFEEKKQAMIADDKASREERFNEVLENGMAEEILAMKGFTVGKEPDDPTAMEILSSVKQKNEDTYNRWIEEYRDYKRQQREEPVNSEVGFKK